jgi:hypothetical protein
MIGIVAPPLYQYGAISRDKSRRDHNDRIFWTRRRRHKQIVNSVSLMVHAKEHQPPSTGVTGP